MKHQLLLLPVLLLAGCNVLLPGGNAPEGRITDNTQNHAAATKEEFENHAATSLCAHILMGEPIAAVCCTDEQTERILAKITAVTGTASDKNASLRLTKRNNAVVLLSEEGKILWQYPAK